MTGRTWDAIVIGAGPAGSVAARQLARRGASVLLVDKAVFPRAKVCGCCLNGAALAALDAIGLGHIPKACGGIPLRITRLAAGKRSAELRLDAGVALSREALDSAFIREAQAAGAVFLPGALAKIDGIGEAARAVSVSGGKHLARIAIEATGLSGGRAATVRPASRLGAGTIIPREVVPEFFAPGTVYMAIGRGGYVGIVRLEDGRLDLGAALDAAFVRSAGGLGPAAAAIVGTTDWPSIPGLAEFVWKGTPALSRQPEVVADRRLFRIGDAAGYVEPFTGEGMAWAIASAAALAPIAHRAIADWDDRFIREWQRTHRRTVGRQGVCRVAAKVLRSPRFTGLAVRALAALPALARPVVALLNRPALHPEPLS